MNTLEIEDRVRAATRAAADTVAPDSVPPLRLPFRSRSGSRVRSRFRAREGSRALASVWARRLAPLAAAVAVVAVAVTMVTVGRNVDHGTGGTGPASVSARPGPVRTGPAVSSYVASGAVPRYYVSIESLGNPNFNPTYAVVRATATGARMDTVAAAADRSVVAVTAAANDRTFILDEQPWVSSSSNANQTFEPRSFVKLSLGPDGHVLSLAALALSVPAGQMMTGFALSPDGTKLAIAVQPDNNKREPNLTEVKVVTLATGATVTWTANGTIGFGPDDARSLSWADNERTLAFDWAGSGPGEHTGVWLLDLETGGGSLLAHSREAVTLVNQGSAGATWVPSTSVPVIGSASTSSGQPVTPPTCQEDSIITPDGSAIVCGAITALNETLKPNGGGLQRGAETEFFEYSTASGKVARVLGHWTFGSVGALSVEVLWSNASGSVLIGVIPNRGGGRVGVISGNEFTPLPATVASAPALSGTW
jgi:hypothetical protein